jgi:pimeloyl-ACP methyl ester carboxylesterase
MRRLIKPISTLLLVAIPMAVVDPALAETRTARNGEAVIEYQIDGKGPAVLMIASLGRPATDFDELSAGLVAAGYSTIRPQPRGIGGGTGPMSGLSLRDLAADAMAAADDGPIIVIGHDFGQRVARMVAALYPDRVESVVMLGAGGKVPMLPGAGEALGAVFDATFPPDKHMDAVRFAFFAPGNDPSVWRATAGIPLSHECRPLPRRRRESRSGGALEKRGCSWLWVFRTWLLPQKTGA